MKSSGTVSRRDAMRGTAGLLGGLALSTKARAEVSQVTATLARYMAAAGSTPLPADALEKTKQHVLDTFAAMISGAALPPGQTALKFAAANVGDRSATVAASKLLCGPIEAAMVNGMLAHSDETDDSHSPSQSHPGASVVPAALAAGERFGISGERFLRAVALGYDVGPRVSMTLGALAYQNTAHFSTHSISGTFGSAAAAGCAASLNETQMRWLLDYAGQQASGVAAWQRDTDHISKSLVFAGTPARNGVNAALLIQLGATGVDDIFSGADNFFAAFNPKADPAGLIDKLGQRFEVTRTTIKKWTVGSPIQAPLDAIDLIRKKRPFEADQVKKVTVRVATNESKIVNNREMPDISLQHMAAVMLIDKTASFAAAHDKPRMNDSLVLKHKAKVDLIADEELEKLIPERVAIVEIEFTDGTKLSERVTAVRGTPANPMPREEVVAKCRDLLAPVLGAAGAKRLIDTCMSLESVRNVRELRPMLQKG